MRAYVGALLIYTFADLRDLIKTGELPGISISDLEPPISIEKVLSVIAKNREILKEKFAGHEEFEQRMCALKDFQPKMKKTTSNSERKGKPMEMIMSRNTILTHFNDEKSTEEMVHGITVNYVRRRITIIFRGSVTQQDFIIDAKCHQKKVANPVSDLLLDQSQTTKTINIHSGFHEYLSKTDQNGDTRLERIICDVKNLLKENPGYRVYCTGHSLGGALSTLCGFYFASDDEIIQNGPVTIVSIASPLVGNMEFRVAFQALERQLTKKIL